MKHVLLLALVAVALFAGCASRYKITLTNGTVLTTTGRPKYDKATDTYVVKDARDQKVAIPSARIRQIEPISRGSKPNKFQYN